VGGNIQNLYPLFVVVLLNPGPLLHFCQFYQIWHLCFHSFEHIAKSLWGPGCISHGLVISLSTPSDLISGKEPLFEQVDCALQHTVTSAGRVPTSR